MAEERYEIGRARAGPPTSANLAEVLERVLDKGIVIAGDVKLLVADIEILTLQIRLVICSVEKAREIGIDWWTMSPAFSSKAKPQQSDQSSISIEERLRRIEESLIAVPKPH
jgi:hypothetical protein